MTPARSSSLQISRTNQTDLLLRAGRHLEHEQDIQPLSPSVGRQQQEACQRVN